MQANPVLGSTGLAPAPVRSGTGRTRVCVRAAPRVLHWLVRLFGLYSKRYLRRHFHSLRVSRAGGRPAKLNGPLVIYLNHAAWWDPLVCLFLQQQFFPQRRAFAPIAAPALRRYPLFERLGFFGVEQGTTRGAREFLRTAGAILEGADAVLWMTPQGHFRDVRDRPVAFQQGIGHLAGQVHEAVFQPMAIEYAFWQERHPEVLVRFGEPLALGGTLTPRSDPSHFTAVLEQRLAWVQDDLAGEVQARDESAFELLLRGQAGVGFVYDLWRAGRALLRGEEFQPEHGVR